MNVSETIHTLTVGGVSIVDIPIWTTLPAGFLLLKLAFAAQDAIVKVIAFVDNFITTLEEEEMSHALNKYRSVMARKLSPDHNDDDENALIQEEEVEEPEPEEEVEEGEIEDPETYSHEWTCSNCEHVQTDDFPFGITVEDALGRDVECVKCGCY